ncbi:DUF2202 domain-containing protein [Coraliomargarita sp. W4R53]
MKLLHKLLLSSLFITCLPWATAETSQSGNAVEDALTLQLDEERLAYQLYTALGEIYPNLRQFQNIPRAEARHFQALKNYIAQNYPNVEQLELAGDFINPSTQALYDRLYAEGKTSTQAALNAGVQVEVLDIKDLDAALLTTEDETLRRIYTNLRAGSEKHLAAFSGNKQGQGKGKAQGKNKGQGNGQKNQASADS